MAELTPQRPYVPALAPFGPAQSPRSPDELPHPLLDSQPAAVDFVVVLQKVVGCSVHSRHFHNSLLYLKTYPLVRPIHFYFPSA